MSQIQSWTGEWAEASRLADESRAIAEWTGQRGYLSFSLYAKALVESLQGDVDRAAALGEESLELARQTGSAQAIELAGTVLGFLEPSRGDAKAPMGRPNSPIAFASAALSSRARSDFFRTRSRRSST